MTSDGEIPGLEQLFKEGTEQAYQGALAFATGNGRAWMRQQAEEARQRLEGAYDGPRDERPAEPEPIEREPRADDGGKPERAV